MPDASASDPEVEPQAAPVTNVAGGVNVDANQVTIGGNIVGHDKTTTSIDTGGGALVEGNVYTTEFVGRDKIVGFTPEQVSTLLTQISSTFQPKPFDGRCPYLGLDAFSEDDADRFFGRETLVSELVARVKEACFVVIAGPSGSGKSSFVRAGLIHALRQGALPNSDRWLYATLTPGRDPIESLALAMSRLAKSPDAGKYLREHSTEPSALHDFAESQLNDRKDQRAVIFVDQFEEVFTQVSKEDERLALLELLTHAATVENGRVTVLFALRSDFVSKCATYPQLNALLNQQFMQVGAMQPDELVSAIARPALQVGLGIDPDLIAQIVNDMQDEPGALPLMQFALKDLFDAQQARGGVIELTLDDYLARGGLRKALERHADAAFAKLNPNEQQLARTIFSGLIEIGRGTQDTRRTAVFDELVPTNTEVALVKEVVRKLADERLITTDERDHHVTVTIAHETLIDAWSWLRKLINENREAISLQNQIVEDAQEWDEHQRDASYLYGGARLATAREQLATNKIVLSGLAHEFVKAGVDSAEVERRREEARRQKELDDARELARETEARRRTEEARAQDAELAAQRLKTRNRIITAAVIVSAALAIMAGVFSVQSNQATSVARTAEARALVELNSRATAEADALKQRDEAQRQSEISFYRQLAAQGTARLVDNFDLALLLSVETARLGEAIGSYYEGRDRVLKSLLINTHLAGFLSGHTRQVTSVAFSPDSKTLASGSWDESVMLWDVATQQRLGRLFTGYLGWVTSVAFSPDGKTLASGLDDGNIILWDVTTQQRLGDLAGHTGRVTSVSFSPDGKSLASGSWDNRVVLWDVVTRQARGEPITGHSNWVESVAFSPDGKTLASGSVDGIFLWDVSTSQSLAKPFGSLIVSVAFSPDGKTLASGINDGSIIFWDVATRQSLGTLVGHSGRVASVAFSPDGKMLASGGDDSSIILWDMGTHQRLGEPLSGHSGSVASVAFSPDGRMLASGSLDKHVILWNVSPGLRLGEPLNDLADLAPVVATNPNGKMLALGTNDGKIILWDTAARHRSGEPLTGHTWGVNNVAFSPDGKILASRSVDSIILWDVATRQRLGKSLVGNSEAGMAFSPNGKILAIASDDLMLWDVAAQQQLGELSSGPIASAAFDPDGEILASGGADGNVILWDVSTRQPVGEPLQGHTNEVTCLAFSPDGNMLASGSYDGSIILWDMATRQRLGQPLTGQFGRVKSAAFSPDGRILASGNLDGNIILWDVATRQPLGEPLTGHSNRVTNIAFSPDGKILASSSCGESDIHCANSEIILWDVDPESWQARACQVAGRNFTRAEWTQYLGDKPYRQTCEQWPLESEATPTP